ncbi:MAG TPA: glutamine--fructose-6-phosphate aminotransferase, partial [Amycolatopsis sp.]|nr:glutamine--fructose-6-phosphate aminotransferase [Amycolatopsis sp.]
MCGIVGYVGHRRALDVVLGGLRRMEYRGYDSAGVAVLDGAGALTVERKAGRLANLEDELAATGAGRFTGTAGMGHTRWATHGAPVDRNSHPHRDSSERVAVVHNGIIENFAALRAELEADGVELSSDTDTETAAHLVARAYDDGPAAGDLPASVRAVCRRLEGAFTLVVTHADEPDLVVAARRSSPLVVGVGDGETFVASDVAAFIEHTREAVELGQDQLVVISRDGYTVTDFSGEPAQGKPFTVSWDLSAAEKGGHD